MEMGFFGFPRLNLLVFLILGVAINAVAGARATVEDVPVVAIPEIGAKLAATCRPIDPCRGAVANQVCCKAINAAIVAEGGCACVCKVLKTYSAQKLPVVCLKSSTCAKCVNCACS